MNVCIVTKIIKKKKKNWWNLKETFFIRYKFSNHDINKFTWLLQKGAYPYKYMDDRENFSEAL